MDNPILHSERFDRSVTAFSSSVELLHRYLSSFDESVAALCRAVDKLGRIAGMQAENDQRKAIGASMAYTEDAFANL